MGQKQSLILKDVNNNPLIFTLEEELFLFYQFKQFANRERMLDYEQFHDLLVEDDTNDFLTRKIFDLLDKNKDGLLEFEDYKRLCEIILRGCVEIKLELLFNLLKANESDEIINVENTRLILNKIINDLKSSEMDRLSEEDRRISEDHINRFLEKIFLEAEILKIEDFVMHGLNCKEGYRIMNLLDSFLIIITNYMDSKLKTQLYKLPYNLIVAAEGNNVPKAVYCLTQQMKEIIIKKKENTEMLEREIYSLTKKKDIKICDALVSSYHLGYAYDTDLSGISLSILVFTLKNLLAHIPAPLLTFTLSRKLMQSNIKKKTDFGNSIAFILKSIPIFYRNTIICIIETFNLICKDSNMLIKQFSFLFACCFVKIYHELEFNKASYIVEYLILNGLDIFSTMNVSEEIYSTVEDDPLQGNNPNDNSDSLKIRKFNISEPLLSKGGINLGKLFLTTSKRRSYKERMSNSLDLNKALVDEDNHLERLFLAKLKNKPKLDMPQIIKRNSKNESKNNLKKDFRTKYRKSHIEGTVHDIDGDNNLEILSKNKNRRSLVLTSPTNFLREAEIEDNILDEDDSEFEKNKSDEKTDMEKLFPITPRKHNNVDNHTVPKVDQKNKMNKLFRTKNNKEGPSADIEDTNLEKLFLAKMKRSKIEHPVLAKREHNDNMKKLFRTKYRNSNVDGPVPDLENSNLEKLFLAKHRNSSNTDESLSPKDDTSIDSNSQILTKNEPPTVKRLFRTKNRRSHNGNSVSDVEDRNLEKLFLAKYKTSSPNEKTNIVVGFPKISSPKLEKILESPGADIEQTEEETSSAKTSEESDKEKFGSSKLDPLSSNANNGNLLTLSPIIQKAKFTDWKKIKSGSNYDFDLEENLEKFVHTKNLMVNTEPLLKKNIHLNDSDSLKSIKSENLKKIFRTKNRKSNIESTSNSKLDLGDNLEKLFQMRYKNVCSSDPLAPKEDHGLDQVTPKRERKNDLKKVFRTKYRRSTNESPVSDLEDKNLEILFLSKFKDSSPGEDTKENHSPSKDHKSNFKKAFHTKYRNSVGVTCFASDLELEDVFKKFSKNKISSDPLLCKDNHSSTNLAKEEHTIPMGEHLIENNPLEKRIINVLDNPFNVTTKFTNLNERKSFTQRND